MLTFVRRRFSRRKRDQRIAGGFAGGGAGWRFSAIAIACGMGAVQSVRAGWSTSVLPVLAQAKQTTTPAEPAAEASWPIIDWAIVVVLIAAALFVICRSSRRN